MSWRPKMKLTDHSGPNFLEGLLANAPVDVLIIKAAIIATRRPKGARRRDRHICIQFAVNPGTSISTSAPGYHFQSGIFRLFSRTSSFAYTKYTEASNSLHLGECFKSNSLETCFRRPTLEHYEQCALIEDGNKL